MKKLILFTLLLIAAFSLSVFAQTSQSKKLTGQTTTAPTKKKMIMSFERPEKMFQILEGKWRFQSTDCQTPFTINADGLKTLELIYPKSEKTEEQIFTYKVLETGKYYIRTQIEGEKRLDDNGKPQVWDFMILSNDEFIWHRTDWQGLKSTPPVFRCK